MPQALQPQASKNEAAAGDSKEARPVPAINLPKGGGAIRGIGE